MGAAPLHVLCIPGPADAWAARRRRFVSLDQHSVTVLSDPHVYWRMK